MKLDLTPGKEYWYWTTDPDGSRRRIGPYTLVCVCRHPRTDQEVIAYRPVGGGQTWCCTLHDFALRFTPVEPEAPAPEPAPQRGNGRADPPTPDRPCPNVGADYGTM